MSALDSVLADLVESDRNCAYVTVKRQPLEALIEEWLARGDQISLLCDMLARAQKELAVACTPRVLTPSPQSQETILHELNSATAQQGTTIAHHRSGQGRTGGRQKCRAIGLVWNPVSPASPWTEFGIVWNEAHQCFPNITDQSRPSLPFFLNPHL